MSRKKGLCFVVMPFGIKTVGRVDVDFNKVFKALIQPAGEAAGLQVERADTREATGSITGDFLNQIYNADVVVADITYPNANVFYELGVRHALTQFGTVMVRLVGGELAVVRKRFGAASNIEGLDVPFDVKDVTVLPLTLTKKTLGDCVETLTQRILLAANQSQTDSPVYHHIKGLRVERSGTPAPGRQDRTFEVVSAPGRYVGYRSGDIFNLKGEEAVDYWASSENSQMQMARTVERSVSSTIRHYGARDPDPRSPMFEDTVADALKTAMGNKHAVDEGDVVVTTSGRLAETHNVRAVIHAATVTAVPGRGFECISDARMAECVRKVLDTARELARHGAPEQRGRSIALPLFGTGQARRDPTQIAGLLVSSAIQALEDYGPKSEDEDLSLVVFSAYTQGDVDLLRRIFEAIAKLGRVAPIAKSAVS